MKLTIFAEGTVAIGAAPDRSTSGSCLNTRADRIRARQNLSSRDESVQTQGAIRGWSGGDLSDEAVQRHIACPSWIEYHIRSSASLSNRQIDEAIRLPISLGRFLPEVPAAPFGCGQRGHLDSYQAGFHTVQSGGQEPTMEDPSRSLSPDQVSRELSEPLRRYLGRHVGNAAVADDLLQETLIRIARGLPTFAGRSSMKTWAFSIATRVAADYFRQPAQRVRIVDVDELQELSDTDLMVDQRLVIDEMNACVRKVIDSLPEEYRAALILHDLEDLTAAQVAEVCGCSVPTAKIRIHRARLRLKETLRGECDFYRDSENVLRCDRKGQLGRGSSGQGQG